MNFNDVLKTKGNEIERPPLIPVGTYRAAVAKCAQGEAGQDWDTIDFQLGLIEAQSDVDPDELAKYGSLKSSQVRHSFMFSKKGDDEAATARTLFNLKRFLSETLKVENIDNMSIKEALTQVQGRQLLVQIGLRPDKNDTETFYNQVKKTAPLE